tara:strand:+ start:43 stop:624 length:582 start_codon:yes stop_codon:yes gene_type:complete
MTAKIKLNAASGGGSFSLQAPSSSANNRVMTLPDTADGTILTTTNPKAGNIIQVVTGTSTSAATTASTTFAEITSDLRCTIVPTAANSKIIISASLYFSHEAHVVSTRILKDGSTLVSGGTTANTHDGDQTTYIQGNYMVRTHITVEETAGNTNSRYYSPFWNTDTATAYFNRYFSNTQYDGTSSMVVMEVAV